mgnify:FL=1
MNFDGLIRFGDWLAQDWHMVNFIILLIVFFLGCGYLIKCLKGTV